METNKIEKFFMSFSLFGMLALAAVGSIPAFSSTYTPTTQFLGISGQLVSRIAFGSFAFGMSGILIQMGWKERKKEGIGFTCFMFALVLGGFGWLISKML